MTFTYYGITLAQLDCAFKNLGIGPDKDGMISGDTPQGKLTVRRDWNEASGQLTIVVFEKPGKLDDATIDSHIRTALAVAQGELDAESTAPTPKPDPATVPVVPANTQGKTVSGKRVSTVVVE
jgi:hypothetical protein